jgi:hypothetical protein
MELYPEALFADGIIRADGVLCRLLLILNELGLSALAGVICLGDRQRQRLEQYRKWHTSPGFCLTVPPWDYRPLKQVPGAENRFLAQHEWCNRRIVLYAGNLGRGHTYKDILAAAHALSTRGDTSWLFVFVCRGATRPALEEESKHLGNVAILDYVPPEQTSDLLWSAAVHLITMANGWQGIIVPSKLYGILQTASPVLFIGPQDADTACQICYYDAGVTLPNGCGAAAVIDTIERLCTPQYYKARSLDLYGADCVADFITRV